MICQFIGRWSFRSLKINMSKTIWNEREPVPSTLPQRRGENRPKTVGRGETTRCTRSCDGVGGPSVTPPGQRGVTNNNVLRTAASFIFFSRAHWSLPSTPPTVVGGDGERKRQNEHLVIYHNTAGIVWHKITRSSCTTRCNNSKKFKIKGVVY